MTEFGEKMKYKYCILLIAISLCVHLPSMAQTTVYGVNVGFGKSTVVARDEEPTFLSPFNSDYENFMQLGLDYAYAPGNSSIYFKSGLIYNARTTDETALDYIRAPLGLDIGIGNAFQFIFGANVFSSFLLAYTGFDDNEAFNDSVRRFQFGWGGNLGFGLDITDNVNLNVMYQRNFDLTEVYNVETRTVDGVVSENFLGQDGFVRMGLSYRLHQQ
jgi:hypothetical protein